MISKIKVDGIILVLSCNKYLNTRLKRFKLPKDAYGNWKVIYVIGNLFLDADYKIDGNLMTIKCEDSYIHLLKKLVVALKHIYNLYDIKDGVLRCGDDLIFNEKLLQLFLNSIKSDFIGTSPTGKSLFNKNITANMLKATRYDNFMLHYYASHPEDFVNPLHNLKGVDIGKYIKRPNIEVGPAGIIYYISNKSCQILMGHMENIKYNIFHFDTFSQSYPYTIEDCAVPYILYCNKITFIHLDNMYLNYPSNNAIVYHTNGNSSKPISKSISTPIPTPQPKIDWWTKPSNNLAQHFPKVHWWTKPSNNLAQPFPKVDWWTKKTTELTPTIDLAQPFSKVET